MIDRVETENIALTYDTAYQASVRIDPEYFARFQNNKVLTDEFKDPCGMRALIRRVMVMILGLSSPQTITYKTPINWFEMLKRDHAPEWFKRRFPVKEYIDTVEVKDIFPFPNMKFPDSVGNCVRIATVKRSPWEPANE